MINELIWDSNFFKRKIGKLEISTEPFQHIETVLERAKVEGFRYIICKLESQETLLISFLEARGFYLSDIGVTWSINIEAFSCLARSGAAATETAVAAACPEDIPILKEMAKALFVESRFYHDHFFTKNEADAFYQAWVENSVKGHAADTVFHVPGRGLVTCLKKSGDSGEIVLIGVTKDSRAKGIGTALVNKALQWFHGHGVRSVSVRTQLRNLDAMNFYLKLGFSIEAYDITLAKIL